MKNVFIAQVYKMDDSSDRYEHYKFLGVFTEEALAVEVVETYLKASNPVNEDVVDITECLKNPVADAYSEVSSKRYRLLADGTIEVY